MTNPERRKPAPPTGILGGAAHPVYPTWPTSAPTGQSATGAPAGYAQPPAQAPGTFGGTPQPGYPTWPPPDAGQRSPWRPTDPTPPAPLNVAPPAPSPQSLVIAPPAKPNPVRRPTGRVWNGDGNGAAHTLLMIGLVIAGIIAAFLISLIGR